MKWDYARLTSAYGEGVNRRVFVTTFCDGKVEGKDVVMTDDYEQLAHAFEDQVARFGLEAV